MWPLRFEPAPQEIFSSWLIRTSLGLGCDPLALTGYLWPRRRVWMTDIDRGLRANEEQRLEALSGVAQNTISKLYLRGSLQHIISEPYEHRAVWPWILTTGSRNRKRLGGLQFCPACLADDHRPYFRRHWRFAWHVGCDIHGTLLHDRCEYCLTPVEAHRVTADAQHVAICATCRWDFANSTLHAVTAEAMAFQRIADAASLGHGIPWGTQVFTPSEWFACTRHAAAVLRQHATKEKAVKQLDGHADVRIEFLATLPNWSIELLPVTYRHRMYAALHRLFQRDIVELSALLRSAELTTSLRYAMRSTALPSSDAYHAGYKIHRRQRVPHAPQPPKSKVEVQRAWTRIRRRMRVYPDAH